MPFGFEPYHIQKIGLVDSDRIKYLAPSRSKNVSIFDEFSKEKKWVPGAKYIEHSDWNLTGPKVGKWGTYKKQTFFQDIMN